jgi:hypothetical protein
MLEFTPGATSHTTVSLTISQLSTAVRVAIAKYSSCYIYLQIHFDLIRTHKHYFIMCTNYACQVPIISFSDAKMTGFWIPDNFAYLIQQRYFADIRRMAQMLPSGQVSLGMNTFKILYMYQPVHNTINSDSTRNSQLLFYD